MSLGAPLFSCAYASRVPWTTRSSNQSILKEISPGCSLEGLMLKLKLQYFGHLMWRIDSLEKTLMLGGIGDRRRRRQQRMRWLDSITDSMGMGLSQLREFVMDREAWQAVIHGVAKSRTRLSDWTELNWYQQNLKFTTMKLRVSNYIRNIERSIIILDLWPVLKTSGSQSGLLVQQQGITWESVRNANSRAPPQMC